MSGIKQLHIQILDRHLAELHLCDRPVGGWIAAIRTALGMSMRQLGVRMGTTQQSAARMEQNELEGSITLRSLRKAAEALDCRVAYVLIPNAGSLDAAIRAQAHKKAAEIATPVDHTMQLEGQGVGNLPQMIDNLAAELARNPNYKLWD